MTGRPHAPTQAWPGRPAKVTSRVQVLSAAQAQPLLKTRAEASVFLVETSTRSRGPKKKHLYTDAERPTIKEQAGEKMARRKKPAEEAQKRGLGQRRSKNEPPENSRGGPKTMPGSPEPGRQGGGWPATCMPAFLSWKSGSYTLHHTPNSKRPSLHAYLSQA